jgi:hypothetical protein
MPKAKQPPLEVYQEDHDYCNDPEFICADRVFDHKKPEVFKNCTANDDQINKCHILQGADVKLFELIDEKKLYPNFYTKMKEFVAILNTKLKDNEDMKKKIKSLYNVDIESDDNILLAVPGVIGKNEHYCNDMIGFVDLNTLPKKYPLFHISIHPKASKYYKKPSTAVASCGYYSKKEHSQGSGAFHYKIETLANGAETTLKNKPFKQFMTAGDDPGKFKKNEDKFVVREELIAHASDELHELHNFFYDEFIDFWNNTIVIDPTFRRSEPLAPEQLVPEPPVADEPLMPEPPVADEPLMPRKRPSQYQSSTGQSEATDGLQPARKSSRKDSYQPLKTSGEGKRIRRKTIKKRKTKKRKTIKRKPIKRKTIKKRKTSKR